MSLVILVTCSEPDSRFSLGDLREDGDGKSPFFFFFFPLFVTKGSCVLKISRGLILTIFKTGFWL